MPSGRAVVFDRGMAIVLGKPGVDGLNQAVGVLREWQYDAAPMQLHPGDLGWFWRFGAEATAAAVRTWSRDGQVLAVGLLDGPKLLRLTIAPDAQRDEELAEQLVDDMACGRIAVLRRAVPGRVRRRGQRGGGGDGVVGRPCEARVARANGRAPGTSRSWLRQGNHPRRGGRAPGAGLVKCDRLHPKLQWRRRRHLRVGWLPATP